MNYTYLLPVGALLLYIALLIPALIATDRSVAKLSKITLPPTTSTEDFDVWTIPNKPNEPFIVSPSTTNKVVTTLPTNGKLLAPSELKLNESTSQPIQYQVPKQVSAPFVDSFTIKVDNTETKYTVHVFLPPTVSIDNLGSIAVSNSTESGVSSIQNAYTVQGSFKLSTSPVVTVNNVVPVGEYTVGGTFVQPSTGRTPINWSDVSGVQGKASITQYDHEKSIDYELDRPIDLPLFIPNASVSQASITTLNSSSQPTVELRKGDSTKGEPTTLGKMSFAPSAIVPVGTYPVNVVLTGGDKTYTIRFSLLVEYKSVTLSVLSKMDASAVVIPSTTLDQSLPGYYMRKRQSLVFSGVLLGMSVIAVVIIIFVKRSKRLAPATSAQVDDKPQTSIPDEGGTKPIVITNSDKKRAQWPIPSVSYLQTSIGQRIARK